VDASTTVEDMKCIIEAEAQIVAHEQLLYLNGGNLVNGAQTAGGLGMKDNDLVLCMRQQGAPQMMQAPMQPGARAQANPRPNADQDLLNNFFSGMGNPMAPPRPAVNQE